VSDGQVFVRSDAVLRVTRELDGLGWTGGLLWIPRVVRDLIYRAVARHRHRLFGLRDSCRVPTPEERARFLP
jgi:predicted DCC family thiol-disulfide oxidoreductase YuxK